ncbi:MAG: AAA family ATPase [Lachnospiraceae bacterium]|nr:AAA family ATPase [Lachnospiraceae bacterium]
MIHFTHIESFDKTTVCFLNQFEVQLFKELQHLLKSGKYQRLGVKYSLSVDSFNQAKGNYAIDSNASLSLPCSNEFVANAMDYLKSRSKELNLFLESNGTLYLKLQFEQKQITDKSEEKDNKYESQSYIPIKPRYSFNQVILPKEILEEITDALNIIKYQELIYKKWGFEDIDPIPKSVINLYGPPGTGKTMCAHAISKELNMELLALNYAEIESKYVGDAAKNLSQAFDTAKKNNCVLFFDEADSFLGKRIKNVSQGADQALNSLRSQMLILLEEFPGIVIFATNLVSNFDQAFESRILKHIKFSLPNQEARIMIIKKTLPPRLPFESTLTDEDFNMLSKTLEGLSGREIKGAILECMLNKVSLYGESSSFSFDDFLKSFNKKIESIKKLQEEKNNQKAEKIIQAFKNGKVNVSEKDDKKDTHAEEVPPASSPTKESKTSDVKKDIDEKNFKLICLVSELGIFFGKCDGSYDDSEKTFVNNYLRNLSEKYAINDTDALNIKESVNENETFDNLVAKTNSYSESLNHDERIPFKRTLSYFIYHLIRADGVLHPNEKKYYQDWKNGVNIDDSIDINFD